MAAVGPLPRKKAEEMIRRLVIGDNALDEFTQHRYLHILEDLYNKNQFGVMEYQAYSMLLFQMGRTDEALSIINEGLDKHQDLNLLSISALEKMNLWQKNQYQLDLEKEFFLHPVNRNACNLAYTVEISAVRINDQLIPFASSLQGDVEVGIEDGLVAYVGPYIIEQDYADAAAEKFSHRVISEPIIESYLLHRLTVDEQKYIENCLGKKSIQQLHDCAHHHDLENCDVSIWNIGPNRWVGYSDNKKAAVFGTTHEDALEYFRKYHVQVGA